MTVDEVGAIVKYLQAGCGTKIAAPPEMIGVWYELLGDLPFELVKASARQALIENTYPTIPQAGVVRTLALKIAKPGISPTEAWSMALAAVRKHGAGKTRIVRGGEWLEIDRTANGLASLPPAVANAVKHFGYDLIANAGEAELGIVQTQFVKAYTSFSEVEQWQMVMPPQVAAIAKDMAASFGMGDGPPHGLKVIA